MPTGKEAKNYVYVLASTEDRTVLNALVAFYTTIEKKRKEGKIGGLKSIDPVVPGKSTLDDILRGKPQKLIDAIYEAPMTGLAMFSEWQSEETIRAFVRSDLHEMLKQYSYREAPAVVLTIIQYLGGTITTRNIGVTVGK